MVNPSTRTYRILLVEDDSDTCKMVTMMVEGAGHTINATRSGQDALAFLNQERVDLILLDILMPDIDGLNLLETIRKTSDVPVMMLTAVSHSDIMQQSFILGADDYIIKPFSKEKLLDRISRLMHKAPRPVKTEPTAWTMRYWLDSNNHILVHDGTAINLTEVETRMLAKLMDLPYQEVPELVLDEAAWGPAEKISTAMKADRVIGTIKGLQVKLEEDASEPKILIITAKGYMFNPET